MNRFVTVKSNKYGLVVHLKKEASFETLLKEVEKTFMNTVNFFGNTKLAISFEGRILTKDQEHQLIDLISDTAQIEIVCIIDNDEKHEKMYKRFVEESLNEISQKDGLFCKGTLRKKQVLESEKSIVVLGDVEAGATIVSRGNIIILGRLLGNAHAGAAGNDHTFIVSLSMEPRQLKIGNVSARYSIVNENENMSMAPMIASVEEEAITLHSLYFESAHIQEEMKWVK